MHFSLRSKTSIAVSFIVIISIGLALFVSTRLGVQAAHSFLNQTSSQDNWPMFGYDTQATRFNPNENTLTPSNVSNLALGWSGMTGNAISSSPSEYNGVVYIGSVDDKLYAFASSCGSGGAACSPLWTGSTGGVIDSSPAAYNGVIYVSAYDGELYAFNANGCGQSTCSPLWTANTGGAIVSAPAVANGVVYIGSYGGFYAFNASGCGNTTCSPLWTANIGRFGTTSSPIVVNGWVYIGSSDDHLYAFSLPSPPLPSGTWITPNSVFSVQAGTTLPLSANAYPAQANSSIKHVDFAAQWNGSWQTVCTTTSTSSTFGCNWNLTDANGTSIPNGAVQVEFTVYDSSGTSALSPVLQGTITPPQVQQQTSNNWAGYVVTGKQYTDVKGSWIQPAISCGKKETSFAAFWVGLDGSSSKTVEQIGTEAMCKKGIASYFVWYEMYPAKPVVIFLGLQSGDNVQAEVSYQGNDKFKLSITLSDKVNTWTNPLTVLTRKGAARNSAEWIAEAPCQNALFNICTNNPWPQFGTVTFTSCSACGISIASGPILNESTMTYGLLKSVKGQPTSLNSNNTGFSVQWIHA